MSKFTAEDAKAWLDNLEAAHVESILMVQCALWAVGALNSLKSKALSENPVYSIDSGKQIHGARAIAPWPDPGDRNFESIGRELDRLFHRVNDLLPDKEQK